MSSLVIGLDISINHITAALVRIEQSSNRNLSVERNQFYTRSFKTIIKKDLRSILSVWIECIDNLLHDFIKHYNEGDTIVGIACAIQELMDYERGICCIQASKSDRCDYFSGVNLRLSLKYGLRGLISNWKNKIDFNYYTPPTSPRSSTSYANKPIILQKSQQTKRMNEISLLKLNTFNCTIMSTTNSGIKESELSVCETRNYCGVHDNEYYYDACQETSYDDTTIDSLKQSLSNTDCFRLLGPIIEQLSEIPISFYNYVTCFAVGEVSSIKSEDYQRTLVLILDTNFSSRFIDQDANHFDISSDEILGNYPYDENSTAENWFSIRGLINIYNKLLKQESFHDHSDLSNITFNIPDELNAIDGCYILAERASNGDRNAAQAFQIFVRSLGEFLVPHIKVFNANLIIIGGDIVRAWHSFENELGTILKRYCQVQVYSSHSYEKSMCLGAVHQQLTILFKPKTDIFRQTSQNLLPVTKTIDTNQYDLYPCHEIPIGYIGVGYKQLNENMFRLIEENQILLIDGFVGTYFDEFAYELNKYYCQQSHLSSLIFYDAQMFLRTDIDYKIECLKFSTSIFGRLATNLDFKDFIDIDKLCYLRNNLSYPCVIIGPGASFINETSPVVYIELAKNELYYRIIAKTSSSYLKPIKTIKRDSSDDDDDYELTSVMKCLRCLDYPIFNKLKQELLPRMTLFVDSQRPNCPTWLYGHTFRQALVHIVNAPIRMRPWFQSDTWGGQWLKSVCTNISQYAKNYSRSFEIIAPESGIILSDQNHHLLEFSWDLLYGSQSNRILGDDTHYRLFGGSNDFPLRFNFLDTIDGKNFSVQCHPNLQYMCTNFGEKIAQDKAYYILETKDRWKKEYKNDRESSTHVYLGFHDNIDTEEFHRALLSSCQKKQEFNVKHYIQCVPSNVHDFFLIPNETIHAFDRNQVVLEIATTPYIYIFKLYDWLDLDHDDPVRPFHIEHGIKNLKFDRRSEQLRCQPRTMKLEQGKYEEQHLPTHNLHFYDVQRIIIEPDESIKVIRSTENRFHLCILVEGDAIEIEFNAIDNNQQKQIRKYNYIETFLIPASINKYSLRPIINKKSIENQSHQFILLIAYLKWDCENLHE